MKTLGSYSFFLPMASDYSSSVPFNSNSGQKFLLRDQLVLRTSRPFTLWDLWTQGKHILCSCCHLQRDYTPLIFSHWGPFYLHSLSKFCNRWVKKLPSAQPTRRKVTAVAAHLPIRVETSRCTAR